jgi:hypothetical protein
MRAISAELEGRRHAIMEAKHNLLRINVTIEENEHKLSEEVNDFERRRLQIAISEDRERTSIILRKFEGAMRDIADLDRMYDLLVSELGDVSIENVERAERYSHIHRAIIQSIRSVRQFGVIDTGNQEYLEQCGVNPSYAAAIISEFLRAEKENRYKGVNEINTFVNEFAESVIGV